MSKVSNTKAPVPHIVDSHDLMRVPGAHVNNHKDVSVEIKKLSNSLMRYQAVNVNASKSSETVQRRIEKAVWRSNTVKGSEDCEDYDVSTIGWPVRLSAPWHDR